MLQKEYNMVPFKIGKTELLTLCVLYYYVLARIAYLMLHRVQTFLNLLAEPLCFQFKVLPHVNNIKKKSPFTSQQEILLMCFSNVFFWYLWAPKIALWMKEIISVFFFCFAFFPSERSFIVFYFVVSPGSHITTNSPFSQHHIWSESKCWPVVCSTTIAIMYISWSPFDTGKTHTTSLVVASTMC